MFPVKRPLDSVVSEDEYAPMDSKFQKGKNDKMVREKPSQIENVVEFITQDPTSSKFISNERETPLEDDNRDRIGYNFISPDTILINHSPDVPLDSIKLDRRIVKVLHDHGFTHFLPCQSSVIPILLDRRRWRGDLCCQSPTGSGKSLCYVLPIVQHLSKRVVTRLRCLVVLPTRDLAQQVFSLFEEFAKALNLSVGLCNGTLSIRKEQEQLVDLSLGPSTLRNLHGGSSRVDILISTPGRIVAHLEATPGFTLQHLQWLVVDEADRLMKESFQDWIFKVDRSLFNSLPSRFLDTNSHKGEKQIDVTTCRTREDRRYGLHLNQNSLLQKLLFSATMTKNPQHISKLALHNPLYVMSSTKKKFKFPSLLKEEYVICEDEEKPLFLFRLLIELRDQRTLVFVNSVDSTRRLFLLVSTMSALLGAQSDSGILVEEFSGDLKQRHRSRIIKNFQNGKTKCIISSDAMARGIDVEDVDVVINYEIPNHTETYVHRVGRTARAAKSGIAISLIREQSKNELTQLRSRVESNALEPRHFLGVEIAMFADVYNKALSMLQGHEESG